MSEQKDCGLEIKENCQKTEPVFKYENPFLNKPFASATVLSCTLIIIWRMLDQIGWRSLFPELFSSFDIIPVIFLVSILLIVLLNFFIFLPAFIITNFPIKFHLRVFEIDRTKRAYKLLLNNFILIVLIDSVSFLIWVLYLSWYQKLNFTFLFMLGFLCIFLIVINLKYGVKKILHEFKKIMVVWRSLFNKENTFLQIFDSIYINKFFRGLSNSYWLFCWYFIIFVSITFLGYIYIVVERPQELNFEFYRSLFFIFLLNFFARIAFFIILKEKWHWAVKIVRTIIACIIFTVVFFGLFLHKGGDQLINQAFIAIGARSWQVETFIIHEPSLDDRSFYQTSVFNQKDITYAPAGIKVNSVRLLFLGKVSLLCSPEVSQLETQINKWSQIASKCIAFDSNKVQKWQN